MALLFNRIFGTSGSGDGQFNVPTKLKVYNGEIYVLDYGNLRVEVVDLQGNYVRQWAYPASPAKLGHFHYIFVYRS